MNSCSRRTFVTGAVGGLALFGERATAFAVECVSSYVPARLTVDCASRQNFKIFRQYSSRAGLAGLVSVTAVQGKFGRYNSGNLFLFPWLRRSGVPLPVQAVFPTSAVQSSPANPLARRSVADEFFCGNVLQAPRAAFIGFIVDVPFDDGRARTTRFTNVQLADGQPVGINWTSSNLNAPYFAGSRTIPHTGQCNGDAWRKLIIDGLQQASQGVC
jgi:hypothetical protein